MRTYLKVWNSILNHSDDIFCPATGECLMDRTPTPTRAVAGSRKALVLRTRGQMIIRALRGAWACERTGEGQESDCACELIGSPQ